MPRLVFSELLADVKIVVLLAELGFVPVAVAEAAAAAAVRLAKEGIVTPALEQSCWAYV
jgi:hypothetical protein